MRLWFFKFSRRCVLGKCGTLKVSSVFFPPFVRLFLCEMELVSTLCSSSEIRSLSFIIFVRKTLGKCGGKRCSQTVFLYNLTCARSFQFLVKNFFGFRFLRIFFIRFLEMRLAIFVFPLMRLMLVKMSCFFLFCNNPQKKRRVISNLKTIERFVLQQTIGQLQKIQNIYKVELGYKCLVL